MINTAIFSKINTKIFSIHLSESMCVRPWGVIFFFSLEHINHLNPNVSRFLQECVSRMYQVFLKDVPRVLQEHSNGSFKIVP